VSLVLSLFPGIGLLDRAFEEEGFCIVRGPDGLRCVRWPACRGKRPLPVHVLLAAANAPHLPGIA